MMANMIKALSKAGPQSKGLIEQLMAAGKGASKSGRLGMLENGGKTLPGNLKMDAQAAGRAFKDNPYGAGALGGGAAAVGGAGYGMKEAMDDDEEGLEGLLKKLGIG